MDMIKETKIPDQGWSQHYDVVKELGDCYTQVGDFDQAQQCYDKAATLAPDEAGPYVGMGVIAFQRQNIEDAEIAFKVALRLDKKCSKAYCGLAMIRQQRQQWQEAFDFYLQSLDLNADDLTALLGLFQVSCQMGNFSRVISYLKSFLNMHPGDTAVMYCLATLHMRDKNFHEARELLLKILAVENNNVEAANLLEELEHSLAQNSY